VRRHALFYGVAMAVVIVLAYSVLTLPGDASDAQGLPGSISLGVDAKTSGNTATSLGSIDSCVSVDVDESFPVDVFVSDVSTLLAWEVYFVYDRNAVEIVGRDVQLFLGAAEGSRVIDVSEGLPDKDGLYRIAAADIGGRAAESGSGVLVRLTLTAKSPGVTVVSLPQIDVNHDGSIELGARLTNTGGTQIGDVNGDDFFDGAVFAAQIAVEESCADVTPLPSPTPAVTAHVTLDATLDTVTVGGSTDLLAIFADATGEPVAATDITFAIEAQSGTDADIEGASEVTKTSDATGIAEATLNVGDSAGEITVSATAEGETDTMTVTVVGDEPGQPDTDDDEDTVVDVVDQCPDTASGDAVDASGCSPAQTDELREETEARLREAAAGGAGSPDEGTPTPPEDTEEPGDGSPDSEGSVRPDRDDRDSSGGIGIATIVSIAAALMLLGGVVAYFGMLRKRVA